MENIIGLVVLGLILAGNYKIFEKAGVEGWKSLIPFYNTYVLCQILGYGIGMFVLTLIPVANIVAAVMLSNKLAKSFGKGLLCTVGLILLPFVAYPYLGFSNAQFNKQ